MGLQHLAVVVPVAAGLLFAARCIYLIFLHPLAKVPGPKLFAVTDIPFLYYNVTGRWPAKLKTLHDKYGSTLRFGPNDISSIAPETWKAVYGHKLQQDKTFEKDRQFYAETYSGVDHIIRTDKDGHRRARRVLAHAFSEKALRAQEDIIKYYIDLFITRLTERAEANQPVDIVTWYNFCTFDLIGDLAFGKPFGCLEAGVYNPWVKMIFETLASGSIALVIRRYPFLKAFRSWIIPAHLAKSFVEHAKLSEQTALERLQRGTSDREDFMDFILRHNGNAEKGLSEAEILSNSNLLIIAGSETTATQLSGTTFHLLTNPDKYEKLVQEIRGKFSSEDEITITSANELPYMLAVLNEGFRMYPPVPVGLPRLVPGAGETVDGYFLPAKTSISVAQWSAYQCEENFKDPQSFVPERWLGTDVRYASDKLDALQPFSTGPRNCIGKNLAYAEMRVMLARLLWRFDLELQPESRNWYSEQRIYNFWQKGPLMVRLKPVQRS